MLQSWARPRKLTGKRELAGGAVCKQGPHVQPAGMGWPGFMHGMRLSSSSETLRKGDEGKGGRRGQNRAQGKKGDATIAAANTAARDGNTPLFVGNLFPQMRDSDDAQAVS